MAGEPESLSTDEPLDRRVERHGYDRLLMLSDGVFAIAITLLALELRPPAGWRGGFAELFAKASNAWAGYLIGFMIVSAFWAVHRRVFARLVRADGGAIALSLVLLCLVAASPAVARLMAEHGPRQTLPIYAALIVAMGIVHTLLWLYAMARPAMLHPDLTRRQSIAFALELALPAAGFGLLLIGWSEGANAFSPAALLTVVAIVAAGRRLLRRT
ncbi:DUF1211 domain-containing protein [Sphingomonas sp. MAH-20]|uniref:DUF1211 domain-containing protein n=1 Tax=Sphingomonas horti TaxID=2682842 RepID=A0A6I4J198_9SPHN|nr:TMEM175 family protein [Sphingomonas sp. CGMCC 1.13658]MBA2919510.1 DUF1211 domain-containing protein [Sphingomonas sp. CGMCC 1.13658]MVO78390.1 DUF1211 domain-containing protein [Sphingomonas horti]